MKIYEDGKELISKGIIEDAKKQAENILEDAKKQAEEKIRFARKQAESIINEAEEKAFEQIKSIEKRYESFIELERKKRKIKLRESIYNMVIDGVKKRLREMVELPEYKEILKDWIIEAAIGLGENRGVVKTSKDEMKIIDKRLIDEVTSKLQKRYNLDTEINLCKDDYINGQGVMLFSSDGRRAFNNEVSTRILRKQRKIQQIIYDYLLEKV